MKLLSLSVGDHGHHAHEEGAVALRRSQCSHSASPARRKMCPRSTFLRRLRRFVQCLLAHLTPHLSPAAARLEEDVPRLPARPPVAAAAVGVAVPAAVDLSLASGGASVSRTAPDSGPCLIRVLTNVSVTRRKLSTGAGGCARDLPSAEAA